MRTVVFFLTTAMMLMASPSFLGAQSADTRVVEVIGTGRATDGNLSSAREQAVSDGLAAAVGLVAVDLLSQPAFVRSFENVNRLLFTRADRFVQDYKVLTEAAAGNVYRVMVSVTVSIERVRTHLSENGVLAESGAASTSVLFLVAEQQLEDAAPRCWWQDAFAESVAVSAMGAAIAREGFQVVARNREAGTAGDAPFSATDLTDADAVEMGRRFQADIVVVGTASARITPNVMGDALKSFQGRVTVRALRTETADAVTTVDETALVADDDTLSGGRRALAEAGARAGELLARTLRADAEKERAGQPRNAHVVVEGHRRLAHFVQFRRTLAELPQVLELQTREIAPERAALAIAFEGTTQEIAEALLLKSFDGFGIHITDVAPETVRLSLVPN